MARVLIAEARFYAHLNDMLLDGARKAIEAAGHEHETLTVPGALELPGAIAMAAEGGDFDAYVALGVVIPRGAGAAVGAGAVWVTQAPPQDCGTAATRGRWQPQAGGGG